MRRVLWLSSALIAASTAAPFDGNATLSQLEHRGKIGDNTAYRVGDVIFTQNQRLRAAHERLYPNSLAAEYVRRSATHRDFVTLDAVLRDKVGSARHADSRARAILRSVLSRISLLDDDQSSRGCACISSSPSPLRRAPRLDR